MGAGGRHYAEWAVEAAAPHCGVMVGVTALDAVPPPGDNVFASPHSRMFYCHDGRAFPGGGGGDGRAWGAAGGCAAGDRVGVLVERGAVWVAVNGRPVGPGPLATDLPPQVRGGARRFGGEGERQGGGRDRGGATWWRENGRGYSGGEGGWLGLELP